MIEEKGNDLTQPLDAQDVDVSVNVPIEENKAGEEFKPAPLEENIPNGTEESELEFTKKQIGEISQRALETIGDSNFSSTGLFVASVLLLVKSSADHALHLAPFAITLSVISVLVMVRCACSLLLPNLIWLLDLVLRSSTTSTCYEPIAWRRSRRRF